MRYSENKLSAEDDLQDGFVLIYKNLKQFDSTKGTFKSWAARIMINVCLAKIRKQKIYFLDIDDASITTKVKNQREIANSNLNLQELSNLIQTLPTGQKTVFNLYAIDGFSHKEIAEKLRISTSTSKTQLMKAKNMLQIKINNQQKISNKFCG